MRSTVLCVLVTVACGGAPATPRDAQTGAAAASHGPSDQAAATLAACDAMFGEDDRETWHAFEGEFHFS
jgi:hypothetical protein